MAEKQNPEKVKAKYEKIFSLLDELKIQEAKEKIEKLLKKSKGDPFLFWLKGYVLLYQGTDDLEEAIDSFNKAIEIDPDNAFAWEFKAIALRSLGRYEEAIQCYEKSMELDPLDYSAIYSRALLLERIGKLEEALDYYSLATKIEPDNFLAWEGKANLLESMQRFDEAEECRSKIEKDYSARIVENEPKTPDEWVHKGETLEKLGKYLWANQCYDMALKIDENHQAASDLKYMLLQKHRLESEARKSTFRTFINSEKFAI
ncbi:MAG: Photosystem I assembly protein Ycf3 [Candidatus Methanofastidiosum methylothiophilum]|uniref:Photosystem I assembly protein Ycf3 n=1 Tax=Candidatus Methanofastidiosum methylothiophilum TaxID=1705564 RepID=A0A150IQF9_9EURY|nr:MAG: Photosystem I assembly protein Ycf3 [Candidatus Methanofastidiosum methylthiophilus]KYC47190.1 MAG: Photosystem I assembly protein Ycf3 [Candidatus Methanofastidiosum methylthiophilus]KYC51467.1 MAG: Photosystem I assembly protein Ycf3 [Candidatus Methanofastidiosum methylthiophilus]